MINEEKIKLMTRAEMLHQTDRRGVHIAEHFYGSDYVSLQVVKGAVGVTAAYVILVGLWGLENFEALTTQYSVEALWALAKEILLLYGLVLLAGVLVSLLVYLIRFWSTKDRMKEYQNCLKRLSRIYQREERRE